MNAAYERAFQAGQWSQAGERARQVLGFARKRQLGTPFELAALQSVGDSGRKLGQFREALVAYQAMVAAARDWEPPNEQLRALVPQMLGNGLIGIASCYFVLGPLEQAVEHYEQAIELFRQHRRESEVAAVRAALATELARAGQQDRAVEEFQQALAALEPVVRRAGASAMIRDSYGDALIGLTDTFIGRGRYDLAEPYARRAANALAEMRGPQHPFTALGLSKLAKIYLMEFREREAESLYVAAIEAFEAGARLDTAKYLVENFGAVMIASDTSGLEVNPAPAGADTFIPVHKYLIIEQGMHIGEFHYLEDLAREKAYEFCYIAMTNKIAGSTAGFTLRPIAVR